MSTSDIQMIEQLLPKVEAGVIADALNEPGIWYSLETMGVAVQIGAGVNGQNEFSNTRRLGIADGLRVRGSISGFDDGSFPWNPTPGGTHISDNVSSVKKIILPRKPDGKLYPVVYYLDELEGFLNPNNTVTGIDWTFPVSTKILELITVNDSAAKQHYICEIRVRFRQIDSWAVESAVPCRTTAELATAIQQLRPKWQNDPTLLSFIQQLEKPRLIGQRLQDKTPGNRNFNTGPNGAFNVSTRAHKLPPLDHKLVGEILDTVEFKNASGYEWISGCPAPTTDEDFHIVPKEFTGAFITKDSVGCARCHEGVQISARRHDANNGKRGWNRGNKEGILSFHPFELSSLTSTPNSDVILRQQWIDAGVIELYDRRKHSPSIYRRIVVKTQERLK